MQAFQKIELGWRRIIKMEKEIRIILLGCLCSRTVVEEQQLDNLLTEKIDWIWIVGCLLYTSDAADEILGV